MSNSAPDSRVLIKLDHFCSPMNSRFSPPEAIASRFGFGFWYANQTDTRALNSTGRETIQINAVW